MRRRQSPDMTLLRTSITAVWLAFSLSACVSPPGVPPQHITSAQQLLKWEAQGKLGVRTPSTAKAVNFQWQHSPKQLEIKLHGALGLGSARLSRAQNGNFTLQTKDGTEQAESAESLLYATLGWSLPVAALEYWVKGVPTPEATIESQTFDNEGKLTHLQQQGWKLHYPKYGEYGSLSLPKKIIASRDELRLTIVIHAWRF